MDSRMLNVFHEDPFEGNFAKYDPEPNFWSANDDLQLTDTLNGILPIPPTDESLISQKEAEEQLQNSKNLLIYSDFVDQHLSDDANVLNGQVYRAITDCEVDAAYEQQRHLSVLIHSDDEDAGRGDVDDDDDVQSQSTFRTRTDSSSIGDYESHSSDYDDEDDIVEMTDTHMLTTDVLAFRDERKGRTLSTNTVSSDADALGLNIDMNNFDLADFITKDDFAISLNTLRGQQSRPKAAIAPVTPSVTGPPVAAKEPAVPMVTKTRITTSKSRDSDYDSDSIIDVETVDVIDVDESLWSASQAEETVVPQDLCYVDNVKADPSWSPRPSKRCPILEPKATTASTKTASAPVVPTVDVASSVKPKVCLVPNKKQCDFLKRKMGLKTANRMLANRTKVTAKKMQETNKNTVGKQTTHTAKLSPEPAQPIIGMGLGLGGKNLALLRHEHDAAASAKPSQTAAQEHTSTPAPKRKLNLEEYKQRKSGGPVAAGAAIPKPTSTSKPEAIKPTAATKTTTAPKLQPSPQKAAISSIVNRLKSPANQPTDTPLTDPITVAKNKVLRMLEMKRAQQLKIIDSRISAKVPRVTKLPPLKDIVKDTYCMETEMETDPEAQPAHAGTFNQSKLHADYEEIIIVSASCNTDITIPPHQASIALRDNRATPSSRSLLKSSVLLYNMSHSGEAGGRNMTNSLIASIQSEVVRQTNCVALSASPADKEITNVEKDAQHGEDMVIMHLAKNRVRKRMVSMGTQTELQAEFPMLTLPMTRQSRERMRRSYRKRRTKDTSSGAGDSSTSSASACSSLGSYRSRSRSNSNSIERLRNADATVAGGIGGGGSSVGCGGYSSRSTRRHRSSVSSSSCSESTKYERQQRQRQRQRRTSYNKRRSKNLNNRDQCSTSASEYSDRARSRSPLRRSRSRSPSALGSNSANNNNRRGFIDRNVSQPAVEERRIVYVGRIEQETTKELLRRKFLPYGSIKQITIHYKENGMKYGFVTFERAQDAFTAIDTSPRDAQINMYDISFGGRRAFCRASYADLDNAGINNYHSYVFPKAAPVAPPQEDSFEALLLKVKAKLNAGKPAATAATTTAGEETTTTAGGATKLDCGNNNPSNVEI